MTHPDQGGRFDMRASGKGRVYGNSGHMSFDERQYDQRQYDQRNYDQRQYDQRKYDHRRIGHVGDRYEFGFDPADGFFKGRGPGRVLMGLGVGLALFSFAGWASVIIAGPGGDVSGPADLLGTPLGTGIPVGVIYLLGLPVGGLLAVIGRSMAKAAADHRGTHIGHLVTTMLIVGAGVIAVVGALGGSPASTLLPSFGRAPAGPPVLVSDTTRTGRQSGLSLAVTRVENVGGRGAVHLRAHNGASSSLGLSLGWFKLTDGNGTTYKANHFASEWGDGMIGRGADQAGTVVLDKPVALGTGQLRVEFTSVMGPFEDGIVVSKIPSR